MTKKENIYTVRELEPGIYRIGNSTTATHQHSLRIDTMLGL